MNTTRIVNKISPASTDWLARTGLGAIDLSLARVHQRSAERLVDALFLLGRLLRRVWLSSGPAIAGLPAKRGHPLLTNRRLPQMPQEDALRNSARTPS